MIIDLWYSLCVSPEVKLINRDTIFRGSFKYLLFAEQVWEFGPIVEKTNKHTNLKFGNVNFV